MKRVPTFPRTRNLQCVPPHEWTAVHATKNVSQNNLRPKGSGRTCVSHQMSRHQKLNAELIPKSLRQGRGKEIVSLKM